MSAAQSSKRLRNSAWLSQIFGEADVSPPVFAFSGK
jgi:hypothetical protein